MSNFIFPQAEELRVITANQLPYKTGLAKLFKAPIEFNPFLTAAALAAIEADFSGYSPVTETALPNPYPDFVLGGATFQVPTIQYQVANPATVGNAIHGGWFETAGGVLLMAWQLANPWPMDIALQALALDIIINSYGSTQVNVLINGRPQ